MAHQATPDAILHISDFPGTRASLKTPSPLDPSWPIQSREQFESGSAMRRLSLVHSRSVHPTIISSHGCCSFFLLSMSSSNARKMAYASGKNLITDGFYSVLLANVHSVAPDLPLDPVVFRSLLLCILASGGKNLLLRSYDEDVSLVQSITAMVSVGSPFFFGPVAHERVCERHVSILQTD